MSWNIIHSHYEEQDWSRKPSIFAESIVNLFPESWRILEIGAGLGQDSRFFCDSGFEVDSTDFSIQALQMNQERSQNHIQSGRYHINILDISDWISYLNYEFDVIYAHLSLHYFSEKKIKEIMVDILRILKKWWIFAVLLNTIDDPEYWKGEQIENDFFMISWISKRYFSVESARKLLLEWFDIQMLDNQWETYKDREKWIHNLIRFVWKKI